MKTNYVAPLTEDVKLDPLMQDYDNAISGNMNPVSVSEEEYNGPIG